MTNTPIKLALIVGSTREGRFAPTVARWFSDRVHRRGDFDLDVIDLATTGLPAVIHADQLDEVDDYTARLDRADGFVVVTPEYNHGYPAPLKQAIDLAHREWQAKPVGFVSYGGMSGGLRAVEQLRQVFAELHAVTVRDVVSLHNPWGSFDRSTHADAAAGDDARAHADAAADRLLDLLAWWAVTLRDARTARPYAA